MTRPTAVVIIAPLLAVWAAAAGCQGDGNVSVLGYSTAPPFDPTIRTVYLPVFKNVTFHTSPSRGIEVDLTEAIKRELNTRRTPMRVVSDCAQADTELVGTITKMAKGPYNRTPLNFNREFDVIIDCQVVWRDLRTGRGLGAGARPFPPPGKVDRPFDPSVEPPPPPPPDVEAGSVHVAGFGRVIPELGESNATGEQAAIKQIARQVVNMMERPW